MPRAGLELAIQKVRLLVIVLALCNVEVYHIKNIGKSFHCEVTEIMYPDCMMCCRLNIFTVEQFS